MTTVLIMLWSGAESKRFDYVPGEAELEQIADEYTARNCGVRPTVRVVESFAIPPYSVEDPGPVCEDVM